MNKYPRKTAYIFPIEMQKLISSIPFPRYIEGDIYANMLVVIATVKPNENPYRNRRKSIIYSVPAR